MSFSRGEVVLLPIPFTDLTSRKVRPAVVIGFGRHVGDLFVVPVSSQLQNVDILLMDWTAAGLNVACGIKSQIATIESRLVVKPWAGFRPRIRRRWNSNCVRGCSFESSLLPC